MSSARRSVSNRRYPELAGKHALVTGAARGFGRAIAMRLADEGVTVVVNYRRSMSDAAATVEEIEQRGGKAIALRGDVGKEKSLDKLFTQIADELGHLDILVANAAFGVPGSLVEANEHHWQVTMSASAWSLISMTQRALPLMKNGWGRVVSITSDGGQKVIPGYGVVGPAKGALESITRGLAYELARKGVLVNGVLAGLADTKSARSIPGADQVIQHASRHTPKGRIVNGEDIARVVAFLCSDDAEMICGQFITVDGGRNIVG
ncbi:SDR family oxidoreductase [candidate division GN15 bacterium]|nr:SDR family oxidoreductase [candidate division GN15 bacterium]